MNSGVITDLEGASDGASLESANAEVVELLVDVLERQAHGQELRHLAEGSHLLRSLTAIIKNVGCAQDGVPTKELLEQMGIFVSKGHSKEIERWRDSAFKVLRVIGPSLIAEAKARGLTTTPVLRWHKGLSGRRASAQYSLAMKPFEQAPVIDDLNIAATPEDRRRILYREDPTTPLNTFGRMFYKSPALWIRMASIRYILIILTGVLSVYVAVILKWSDNHPITRSDMGLAAIIGLFILMFVAWLREKVAFLNSGIGLVDSIFLKDRWGSTVISFSHLLNSRRGVGDSNGVLQLVNRYTAKCAICEGVVLLERGGREFPGRIVGRCTNEPVEHVYTFDRQLKEGWPLRDTMRP